MRKLVLAAILTLGLAATSHAGSVSANSTITINFTGACSISAANPAINYTGEDASGSSDVTVNCSNGLAWELKAGSGQSVSGETRRAKLGEEYLTYRLFSDAGHTTEVGVTSNTLSTGTGSGNNQTATAYYAIKKADNQTNPTVGAYTDTLGWTLTF